MSAPDSITKTGRLQALPWVPQDKGEPVFAEPWQAQAFALAVKLSEQGHFTWKEWAAALANELNSATSRGEPDDGSHYYDHWLAALEHLVTAKGLADSATLVARKEAWANAYRSTPHGMPVKLTTGSDGRSHKNAMQGTSGSVARCRKSFGSRKDRAEESASQLGNHVFGRGFSLDASLYGDMFVQVLQPVARRTLYPGKIAKAFKP